MIGITSTAHVTGLEKLHDIVSHEIELSDIDTCQKTAPHCAVL